MAITGTTEFDVDVAPSALMDVLLDVEALPDWSEPHKSAEIIDTHDDGKPKRVKVTVAMLGLTDHEVLEYSWTDTTCAWELLESSQLKSQRGSYTVTESAKGAHVEFVLAVDLKIKLPGLLVKQGQKKAVELAKKGLVAEVTRRSK